MPLARILPDDSGYETTHPGPLLSLPPTRHEQVWPKDMPKHEERNGIIRNQGRVDPDLQDAFPWQDPFLLVPRQVTSRERRVDHLQYLGERQEVGQVSHDEVIVDPGPRGGTRERF